MHTSLQLQINGQPRSLDVTGDRTLDRVLSLLELRADRIAIEHNGEIVPRHLWAQTLVTCGDSLEVVHFVGGGAPAVGSLRLILKNLTALFTSNLLSIVIDLALPAIFLRFYTTTIYADWLVLSSSVGYLQNLNFGLQTYVNQDLAVRYNRGEREGFHVQQSTALRALLGITMIAAIACLAIFFIPIEKILNLSLSHFAAASALYFIALQVVVGALLFSYFTGAYMGVGLAHRGTQWGNLQRFGTAIVLCTLAALRQPLYVLALGQVAWYFIMLTVVIVDFKRKAPDIFPTLKYWDPSALRAMLRQSAYFGLLYWSNFIGFELPIVLLRRFAGPVPTVAFTLGRKMFSFGRQIITGLTQSMGPEITRTFGQDDWPKLYKLYDYSERIIFALIASINIPLFIFSPILFHLWLHKPELFDLNTFLLLGLTATVICIKEHKSQFQFATNTHINLARVQFAGYVSWALVSIPAMRFFGLRGLVGTWLIVEIAMTFAVVRLNQQLFAAFSQLSNLYIARLGALAVLGFAAGYELLHHAELMNWSITRRISADILEAALVATTAYYLFNIRTMASFLKQKLQSRFKPASASVLG